jgi:hypothetical protein
LNYDFIIFLYSFQKILKITLGEICSPWGDLGETPSIGGVANSSRGGCSCDAATKIMAIIKAIKYQMKQLINHSILYILIEQNRKNMM